MLSAIIIAIGGSILANQDGWGRSFADMTLILTRGRRRANHPGWFVNGITRLEHRTGWRLFNRLAMKHLYILAITFAIPVLIVLAFEDQVQIMSASGIIAATHTPFIAAAALIVNLTRLPKELRPGILSTSMMVLSVVFLRLFICCRFCCRYCKKRTAQPWRAEAGTPSRGSPPRP